MALFIVVLQLVAGVALVAYKLRQRTFTRDAVQNHGAALVGSGGLAPFFVCGGDGPVRAKEAQWVRFTAFTGTAAGDVLVAVSR